jgi:mRNA-degrading endonuclease RelE of RelBE toxin-antitoxin system
LAKRYRQIKLDIQPVLDQLQSGDLVGDQVQSNGHPVFKVRIKNSDIQKGKSGGYRLIYYLILRRSLKRFQGVPFQVRLLQSLDI